MTLKLFGSWQIGSNISLKSFALIKAHSWSFWIGSRLLEHPPKFARITHGKLRNVSETPQLALKRSLDRHHHTAEATVPRQCSLTTILKLALEAN
jgi:hypothetical protein